MDGFHDTIRYDIQHETTHAGAVQESSWISDEHVKIAAKEKIASLPT